MRLKENELAPDFVLIASDGTQVTRDEGRGQTTLLSFLRFVMCPSCNLSVRRLMTLQPSLEARGVRLVVLFESSSENLSQATRTWGTLPFLAVADPAAKLYDAYGVEKSLARTLLGSLNPVPVVQSFRAGHPRAGIDGSPTRMPATFVIGPNLRIAQAHYAASATDTPEALLTTLTGEHHT